MTMTNLYSFRIQASKSTHAHYTEMLYITSFTCCGQLLVNSKNLQLLVLSWTNGCKAEKRQRSKLILIAQCTLGSTKANLYILCCKITPSERSVIQENQIMLTLMVCLRLGAIIKQEWQVFIANALCCPEWIDNTAKLISYKYIPPEDLWTQYVY